MGFISNSLRTKNTVADAAATSRALWRQNFGIAKEESHNRPKVIPGGGWGTSVLGGPTNGPAYKRLVEALRSAAPGGWSDDRYEQSSPRHYAGMNYVAIHRICIQLSRATVAVYKKDKTHPKGRRAVTPDDEVEGDRWPTKPYDLVKLLEKPNPHDSFGQMMYRLGQQRRLTGTALTMEVPNRFQTPMELYCIPTCIAIPQPVINPEFPEGFYRIQPVYPYGPFSSYPTPTTSVGAPVSAKWMIRMIYPHPILFYDGYSPQTGLRLHIDELEMMDRSRFYKMKKSFNPDVVMNFPGLKDMEPLPEQEIDRIHAEWANSFYGPENHGGLIVGSPGSELTQFGTTPKDMDYPEGWAQLCEFLLGGGYGITKEAAGMLATSNYATLYAALLQLYWMTLEPEVEDVGNQFTRHLAPHFGDDLIVEIKCKPINDHEQKQGRLTLAAQHKAITYNELREGLELPHTKEEWGMKRVGGEELEMQEQQAQAQGGGQEAMAGMGAMAMGGDQQNAQQQPQAAPQPPPQQPAEVPAQAPEVEKERQRPSDLGFDESGLWPKQKSRKALLQKALKGPQYKVKSMYDRIMEATDSNGNGKH